MSGQTAEVIPFPTSYEPWLTKRQLAVHYSMSPRWVELRVAEGMPSRLVSGRRRFRMSEVEAWLQQR